MSTTAEKTEARQARDEAIERVEAGEDGRFVEIGYEAVKEAARRQPELTSDDAKPLCSVSFDEPRVWGAIMMKAAKDKIIERTDRTRQSSSKICHCREQRVWRSLVYIPQSLFDTASSA